MEQVTHISLLGKSYFKCLFDSAYGQAINLAREIVKFPQACLRADRASAYYATFASSSLESSLQYESENALHVINEVGILNHLPSQISENKHLLCF